MDITIIIPFDKDRGFLNEAVKSAENQVFNGNYEIITAGSPLSQAKNINIALKKARGKYIKILHEDDRLTEDCLQVLFDNVEDNDFICANAQNFGNNCEIFKSECPANLQTFVFYNTIHGGTTMYRKDMLKEVGGYDTSLWTGEEYELHLRLLSKGYKLGYVNATVYEYRIHPDQKSLGANVNKGERLKTRFDEIRKIRDRYDSSSIKRQL